MDGNDIVEDGEPVGADTLAENAENAEGTKSEEDSYSTENEASDGFDEDDNNSSALDENGGNAKFQPKSNNSNNVRKDVRGKKRRKPSNRRRNIRKVLRLDQLDQKTLEAQKEEQERLRRLLLQKSGSEKTIEKFDEEQIDTCKVDNEKGPIMIIDDDNIEMTDSLQSSSIQNGEGQSFDDSIILISSSDSEDEYNQSEIDDESDSADECRSLISTTGFRNENGKILVNVGHADGEPDIFLPQQISKAIKPHQILGVRFLYDNLIESVKDFKGKHGLGCILAHAMGLGKTVQTISLVHVFLTFTKAKKVLILVPINTLQNWLNEFNMWVPEATDSESCGFKAHTENCAFENGPATSGDATSEITSAMEEGNLENNVSEEESMSLLENGCKSDVETEVGKCNSNIHERIKTTELKQYETKEPGGKSQAAEHCVCQQENGEHRKYKVYIINDSYKTTAARSKTIDQWSNEGGVLIMGYEMFRMIAMYTPSLCNSVTNTKGKRKKQAKKSAAVIDIDEEEKEMKLLLGMQCALCKPGPDLVVCDEGHRIKNHQSNIHHALHKIQTRKRLVLTGYPLQNNLTEYWCMVDFVRPNYLGSRQEFQNMFERPIVNGQCIDSTAADKRLMKYRAHVLSSLLKGFVQRSDYSALKVALPPKQEHVIMIRLSPVQQGVYRRFIALMQESYGDQLNPIKIFAVCSKIWNHPDILFKAMKADKLKKDVLFETDEDSMTEDGAKLARNSKFASKETRNSPLTIGDEGQSSFAVDARSLLLKITDWAKEIFDLHEYKEGVAEMSGKLIVLLEILNESLARGDKLLVFSQSLLTLDLIEEFLGRIPVQQVGDVANPSNDGGRTWTKNIDFFRIDGSTSSSERERLIDNFNDKENSTAKLFLLSTRAGCLGINLVGANRVVVFDVSWNPCHDAQAVCRVYRYGQEKPCYIYRLVASNTMEKRMYYRQISKQGVSDRVIDELNPVENFTKDELNKLLSTSWENEPQIDYTEDSKLINDPILKRLLQSCGQWIAQLPFKHESLLQDETSSKLSSKEKREAKRGYEEEKRKVSSVVNGPLVNRFPPYLQGSPLQMAANPQSMFNNYSLLAGNNMASQHPLLPHVNAMNLQTNIALASILRRAELLRQHRLNSASNAPAFRDNLSVSNISPEAQLSIFPNPSVASAHNFPSSSSLQNSNTNQHPISILPGNQIVTAAAETIVRSDDCREHPVSEQNQLDSQYQEGNSVSTTQCMERPHNVEVICIDSDDDN